MVAYQACLQGGMRPMMPDSQNQFRPAGPSQPQFQPEGGGQQGAPGQGPGQNQFGPGAPGQFGGPGPMDQDHRRPGNMGPTPGAPQQMGAGAMDQDFRRPAVVQEDFPEDIVPV
nr:hypothetical protein BaRGS_005285 [Batillaria attramentaria]